MSDMLEKLAGWGYDSLKDGVQLGQRAMNSGVWWFNVDAANGEDARRIHSAYSALWANAPTLFAIVDELAAEVRQLRDNTRVVEEIGGVKVYASGRLARELEGAKETIHRQKVEIERLREELKKAEEEAAKWQHRAREYQLDANAHKANFNAELEGNKKLREKYGARENETWSQWLERMANEAATQKSVAAAWKRDCEAERALTVRLSERLNAIKKAVGDE